MDRYAVIEFSDGLQIVASSWLTEDKKFCYWPSHTSIQRYERTVESGEPHADTWQRHPVIRVMATTNSFQKGKEKLNGAEVYSDLNSGNEDEVRKRRREWAQKHLYSSSDESTNDATSVLPPFPKHPRHSAAQSQVSTVSDIPTTSSSAPCIPNYDNAGKPFQEMAIRLLVELKNKVNAVMLAQRDIQQKLDYGWQKDDIDSGETPNTLEAFPVVNLAGMAAIEEKIKADVNFKNLLVKELTKIGGGDIKTIVKKLLELMLANELADKFSYVGGKKKEIFAALHICKIIQDVTRKHIPSATEAEVATCIKVWLRHAKDRMLRRQSVNRSTEGATVRQNSSSFQ